MMHERPEKDAGCLYAGWNGNGGKLGKIYKGKTNKSQFIFPLSPCPHTIY